MANAYDTLCRRGYVQAVTDEPGLRRAMERHLYKGRCKRYNTREEGTPDRERAAGDASEAGLLVLERQFAGEEFADAKFHPVWAKAEELGILIFIHPQSTPELNNRFKGNGWLENTIGNPLDTTIALMNAK